MSQKYAQADSNGNIIAFYDDSINSAKQIGTASKITLAQWQDCIDNPGKWLLVNGKLQLAPAPTDAELLAAAQSTQIALLQKAYKDAVNAPVTYKNAAGVTSTYPAGDTMQINGKTALQNLEACLDAGSAAWTLGVWLDTNNIAQTFTFADLQGLTAAMSAIDTLDWKDLLAKIAAVQAATTVTDVEAITF